MNRRKKPNSEPATTPAEEWGERVETGRQIARGATTEGIVPGAMGDDVFDPRSGVNPPDAGTPDGMPKNDPS